VESETENMIWLRSMGIFFGYPRLDGLQYILCHIENKPSVN